MSDNETIADIVAEMRNTRFYEQTANTTEYWVRHFADRIEAAAKRETHWDDRETLRNALEEISNLKARLRAIHDALDYDCEYGSCGTFVIDCDDYRDSWFDGIDESEVAK